MQSTLTHILFRVCQLIYCAYSVLVYIVTEVSMATSKYSHQRESIINFLTGRTDHPTADAVYQYLRNDLPTISLGTVYRNLNQMAASGRILRLHVDGKTDHYDACTDPHAHLLCTKCGTSSYKITWFKCVFRSFVWKQNSMERTAYGI